MTIALVDAPVGIREADLRDAGDVARIDRFATGHPASTPFHLTGWSRAVETATAQRARYLIAERADGAIAGVLPLTEMRSVLFGRALVSTGFGVGGGVLGDAVGPLAAAAAEIADRLGCAVELRGGAVPGGWMVDDASYLGFVRPLSIDEAAELAAIPRKQRAEVRRSLTLELDIAVGRDAAAARDHYRVYAESVRNLGTPVFPRVLFDAVRGALDADILTVSHHGTPVASVLSLYHRGAVYPYWGGGTRAARALRANDRMYFALMAHARARGCERFDFGRSKTGSGAAAFKRNWGFEGVPLSYARHGDGKARAVNPTNPRYAAMVAAWRKLPLPIANRIGPWLARGLG